MKDIFRFVSVACILGCTVLSILGIWGFIEGETATQSVFSLVVLAIGLTAAGSLIK
jgi:hypothetical protein